MAVIDQKLMDVATKDARYAYEAYDFILKALDYTEAMLGRRLGKEPSQGQHVKSQELLDGIRALALREFGLMARTVFHMWGVEATEDFGQIVFNLVDAGLIHKTDDETVDDFKGVFDFEEALERGFTIQLDEAR
jgi:uncharacterized repeat protein (TIGR04138 family)